MTVKVSDIMRPLPYCLEPGDTLAAAFSRSNKDGWWALPVADESGEVLGVLSVRDLIRAVADGASLSEPVTTAMVSPVLTVGKETSVDEILKDPGRVVVILGADGIEGIVTPDDLARAYAMQEDELKKTRESLKIQATIVNSMYDGVYITDGHGYTVEVNDAYERITGISRREVVGRHMKELIDSGYFKNSVSLMVIESREPMSIIDDIRGGKRCLTTGTPVFDERGEIVRVVSCVRDMTELVALKASLENAQRLNRQYHDELEHLRRQQMDESFIVGKSEAMRGVSTLIEKVAEVDATVMILGETGVGKEIVAKEIHRRSSRKNGPFIKVNCAAIPENLLESELFGYEKGAFTGANTGGKPGMFELADSGTIFLDEIGELPVNLQAKLLRVLQEKEVTRIGGTRAKRLNVRIISASNKNLQQAVSDRLFREDLYYRLNVLPILVPPLRERREDIPVLVDHFLGLFNGKYGKDKALDSAAVDELYWHSWPGNVRELRNTIERLIIVCPEQVIGQQQVSGLIRSSGLAASFPGVHNDVGLKQAVEEVERYMISHALTTHGSTHKAAKALGVSQPTVLRKARRWGINVARRYSNESADDALVYQQEDRGSAISRR